MNHAGRLVPNAERNGHARPLCKPQKEAVRVLSSKRAALCILAVRFRDFSGQDVRRVDLF